MNAPAGAEPRTTENCRFCWMCRHVCPVGHVTHRETLTPHAWALTIESVARGQLSWNAETSGVMYACADCGLCQSHCVTDQPLPDAIVRARGHLAASGLAAPEVYELERKFRAYANPYADRLPAPDESAATPVALFVGDAGEYLGRSGVDAALALLARAGVTAVPIGRGCASGYLASTVGLESAARALASDVLRRIESAGVRELLVLAPGDRWTFTHVYPERLGLPWPASVDVRTVTSVLAEAARAGRLAFAPPVGAPVGPPGAGYAYHDPCRGHGQETEGQGRAARDLLRAALGEGSSRQLFWREGRAHPCGAVGGLEFTDPALASALAEGRFADAAAAGAGCLVTEDPVCVYHLNARRPAGIDVRNLYEILAAHCA